MQRVRLDLETVTPCFLGGAQQQEPAEWRAASIRGQLRWWFRAVANADWSLDEIREAEERLFGSTSRGSLLQVRALGTPAVVAAGEECQYGKGGLRAQDIAYAWKDESTETIQRLTLRQSPYSNPIHYLGYGCILRDKFQKKVLFEHGRIEAGERVAVELRWRIELPSPEREILQRALWAWLHLGGAGARCRRGFGSLCCLNVEGSAALGDSSSFFPTTIDQWATQARALLPPRQKRKDGEPGPALPEWTRFSEASRIYRGWKGHGDWEEAMLAAGAWLIAFRRRYGSSHHPHPSIQPPKSPRDYEWAYGTTMRGAGIPDRSGFGLPLAFGERGEKVTWGSADRDRRRASPLLIHIAKIGNQYYPVFTYLPARLIPNGETFFLREREASAAAPNSRQENIVRWFLSGLASRQLVEEVKP